MRSIPIILSLILTTGGFSIFSQDSTEVSVFYGDTYVDPIDSGVVFNSIIFEYEDFDSTNFNSIQLEVLNVSSNDQLMSRNIVRFPEDSGAKYIIVDGVLKINMGYYLTENEYRIVYRTEDYQGILGELYEINL